jgi:tRNA(Glu) U13 pseudouridine synthase TruD
VKVLKSKLLKQITERRLAESTHNGNICHFTTQRFGIERSENVKVISLVETGSQVAGAANQNHRKLTKKRFVHSLAIEEAKALRLSFVFIKNRIVISRCLIMENATMN